MARAAGSEWIIVLVNEDDRPHMGVEVKGLEALNSRELQLLYGTEMAPVGKGEFITRLMPLQVKGICHQPQVGERLALGKDITPASKHTQSPQPDWGNSLQRGH